MLESIYILHNKKRVSAAESNELSQEQKEANKDRATQRIKVEHCIGGIKRYRILSHRLAINSVATINCIVGICAELWNLVLK